MKVMNQNGKHQLRRSDRIRKNIQIKLLEDDPYHFHKKQCRLLDVLERKIEVLEKRVDSLEKERELAEPVSEEEEDEDEEDEDYDPADDASQESSSEAVEAVAPVVVPVKPLVPQSEIPWDIVLFLVGCVWLVYYYEPPHVSTAYAFRHAIENSSESL
uniref:Uncharacterized protein n=1 Tax=viral metagenome TaxID=1070528 RepID=A0A6C0HP26_9ZZZZ